MRLKGKRLSPFVEVCYSCGTTYFPEQGRVALGYLSSSEPEGGADKRAAHRCVGLHLCRSLSGQLEGTGSLCSPRATRVEEMHMGERCYGAGLLGEAGSPEAGLSIPTETPSSLEDGSHMCLKAQELAVVSRSYLEHCPYLGKPQQRGMGYMAASSGAGPEAENEALS